MSYLMERPDVVFSSKGWWSTVVEKIKEKKKALFWIKEVTMQMLSPSLIRKRFVFRPIRTLERAIGEIEGDLRFQNSLCLGCFELCLMEI